MLSKLAGELFLCLMQTRYKQLVYELVNGTLWEPALGGKDDKQINRADICSEPLRTFSLEQKKHPFP